MKSCHNCKNLSHVKETFRGKEPVCGYPPRNFNEQTYEYEDIAKDCDDFEEAERRLA